MGRRVRSANGYESGVPVTDDGPRGRTTNGRVVVLAPLPLLTITVEQPADEEIHLHPGGQGVWIARLAASLGADVVLCGTFGGESGHVVRALLEEWGIAVRAVDAAAANGAYIHDRRSGDRRVVAEVPGAARTRHEVDELYGVTLVEGLEADAVVLGGPEHPALERGSIDEGFPLEVYSRLAADLRANGVPVIADLAGELLAAALEGGLDVAKVSDEDLAVHGHLDDSDGASDGEVVEAMQRLRDKGADAVVVTRAGKPSLVLAGDEQVLEVRPPTVDPADSRGGGDALTAGLATALAQGRTIDEALRIGSAAGTLNVTRHGLGSGSRDQIERLAGHVEVDTGSP